MEVIGRMLIRCGNSLWLREVDGSWRDMGAATKEKLEKLRRETGLPFLNVKSSSQNGRPGTRQFIRERIAVSGLGMAV